MKIKVSVETLEKDDSRAIPLVNIATKIDFKSDIVKDSEVLFERYEFSCIKNWLKVLQSCKLKFDSNGKSLELKNTDKTFFVAELDSSKKSKEFEAAVRNGTNIILQALLYINNCEYIALGECTDTGHWVSLPQLIEFKTTDEESE